MGIFHDFLGIFSGKVYGIFYMEIHAFLIRKLVEFLVLDFIKIFGKF